MKILSAIIAAFMMGICFYACTHSTSPSLMTTPYMSLNVGDIREILILDGKDSLVQRYEIVGTSNRADGHPVYVERVNNDTVNLSYYYLSDSYYIATQIKTDSAFISTNPYYEQKLAMLYPQPGDAWRSTIGDSASLFFTASFIGDKTTPCGTFHNVYAFSSKIGDIFYVPKVGWIGTKVAGDSLEYLASYLKVNGVEFGKPYGTKDTVSVQPAFVSRFMNLKGAVNRAKEISYILPRKK